MQPELETRHLRHVVTLARCGTFSSAARALGLSQPALTRSIQAVERQAGVLLFDRHPRGVSLTPVGERMVARAREVLSSVADLQREVALLRGIGGGTLRIGAGPAMRHRLLPDALGRLCARHRRLDLQVRLGHWRDLSRALLDREIDVMLGERSLAEGDERFEVMPLPSETGVWFAHPQHPVLAQAEEGRLSAAALRDHTLALPTLPERVRAILHPLLEDRGRGAASLVECDDLHVLKALALHGGAIALLSESVARDDTDRGRLVPLPVDAAMPSTHPGAIWLRGRSLSPAGRAFLDALH